MVDQEKIHNKCLSNDLNERARALNYLSSNFSLLPNKQQAWEDFIKLTEDTDSSVRSSAADALNFAFFDLPNKQQVWDELIKLADINDKRVQLKVINLLIYALPYAQNKQQAWNNLIKLTKDQDCSVREIIGYALGSMFSHVPNKELAWNDLHRLANERDKCIRPNITYSLGSAFSDIPNKEQAWEDLHKLTTDEDSSVKSGAAFAIGSAFSDIPNKEQAWEDLHKLTTDEDSSVKSGAASAIGSAYSSIPDKEQAWKDLHKLTTDEDISVKSKAAFAIGSSFSYLLDKEEAWKDLIILTKDPESHVRCEASIALGSAFSHISKKKQTWDSLIKLTNEENSNVRTYANYSLGKVSIFKASQANKEEDYKKELEKAIEFFEKASQKSFFEWSNPAQFCLPFYRSFYTIIFKKQEAKEEVDRYLAETKSAILGSESKKQLLEAVENLAEALKEVQSMGTIDLPRMKREINFYRKYCEHAAEIMKCTDEKAPFATEILRKGLPILDRNLKDLIEKIQKKAKIACRESIGTATEEIACAVNQEIQKWEIGSQEEMTFCVKNLARSLKLIIPPIPDNEFILNEIDKSLNEKDLVNLFTITSTYIGSIPTLKMVSDKLNNLEKSIIEVNSKVDELIIISKPGITQEIEISSGIEIFGTGAALITTIPLQDISYAEIKEDLQIIKGEHITKLSKLPKRLANKIKGYLLLKDREDIVEQLI